MQDDCLIPLIVFVMEPRAGTITLPEGHPSGQAVESWSAECISPAPLGTNKKSRCMRDFTQTIHKQLRILDLGRAVGVTH